MTTAVAVAVPCGRRIDRGEPAVLYRDAIYCADCEPMLPSLGTRPLSVEMRHRATCGGGSPLD